MSRKKQTREEFDCELEEVMIPFRANIAMAVAAAKLELAAQASRDFAAEITRMREILIQNRLRMALIREILSQNRSEGRLLKKVNRDRKLWHIYVL